MAHMVLENAGVEFGLPVRISTLARKTKQRLLGGRIDHQRQSIKALEGINLNVREGDRLGIVGHNGSGKTTLLRVLAGIYAPTSGTAEVQGRISTLLTSPPGLDSDETGLTNIKSCALFYGMSRKELRDKIDDVVAFTELGEYLELPVRVYSTGMLTRLSFAIATAIDPEVLIIDEGLAAGDASFAVKAEARVKDLISRSAIVVFASHSVGMLKGLCTRGIALEHGRVVVQGPIQDVIDTYYKRLVEGAERGEQRHLDAAYSAAQDLVGRGEKVPPELEEQALWKALQQVPDDRRMQLRLCQILRQLGKPLPIELEIVEVEESLRQGGDSAVLQPRLLALRAELAEYQGKRRA